MGIAENVSLSQRSSSYRYQVYFFRGGLHFDAFGDGRSSLICCRL